MRFQVPQFIDVEDKVFGPFTFKQFVYLGGGAGLSFVLFRLLPRFLAIIVILPVVAVSVALAFYRVNNRPFIAVVESFFKYLVGGRLYLWRQNENAPRPASGAAERYLRMQLPKHGPSKLKDLTWNLGVNKGEEGEEPPGSQ